MPCGDAHVGNAWKIQGGGRIGGLGSAGEKAEQTAVVPAWVPEMGVLCRQSGQTRGCVSQWLFRQKEGVTCTVHEAERSAQADRGVQGCRGRQSQSGSVVVARCVGRRWGCAISGFQAFGECWLESDGKRAKTGPGQWLVRELGTPDGQVRTGEEVPRAEAGSRKRQKIRVEVARSC